MEKIRNKYILITVIGLFITQILYAFKRPQMDNLGKLVQTETDTLNADVYFVDTIEISNPVILFHKHSEFCYINNMSTDKLHLFSKKKPRDLLRMNWAIFLDAWGAEIIMLGLNYFSVPFYQSIMKYDIEAGAPLNIDFSIFLKKWLVMKFDVKPSKYLLFMYKGKAFNRYAYDLWLDKVFEDRVDFPDENLYYPVVVPVYPNYRK